MAVWLASNAAGLSRSGTYFDPAQDWTMCGWYWISGYFDVTVNEADFWLLDADGLFTTPYLFSIAYIAPPLTLNAGGDTGDGDAAELATEQWFHVAVRYDVSATELTVVANGTAVGSPVSIDLSAMPAQAHEQIGPLGNGDSGFFATGYQRRWQSWLTDAQIRVEAASLQAVLTTTLLADTPLANVTSLQDMSGNGRGWTSSVDLITFDGPFTALSSWTTAGCSESIITCNGGGGGTPTTYPLRRVRRFAFNIE